MFKSQVFFSADGDGGGGGEGNADSSGEAASWHGEHEYFQSNPDATKSFSKFKTLNDSFQDHHHLMQRLGKPYHLPDDGSKLNDDQKAEIRAFNAKLAGVPDSAEGYEFKVPDNVTLDDETMGEYRQLAMERGIDPQTAQDLLNLQFGMVDKLNARRESVIEGMTNDNYKTFLKDDCGGDEAVAKERLELVKRYLQTQFTEDGQADTEGWEAFAKRLYYNDRIIELPLMRALHEAAQMKVGTGGAPADFGAQQHAKSALSYGEMD